MGTAVAVGDDFVVAGARWEDEAGENAGAAYLFDEPVGGRVNLAESAKLLASDATAGDEFGAAVAADGEVIIIGAPLEDAADPPNPSCDSGAAYVFQRVGNAWLEQAKLTASDSACGAWFGAAVSVVGDVVVIGAERDSAAGNLAGAAYIFRFDGSSWNQEAKLNASDAQGADRFGVSVAVAENAALVGARNEDSVASNAGAAYLFRHESGGWLEEAKLTPSDGAIGDRFGFAVALTDAHGIVTAHLNDDACPEDADCDSGSAYVFNVVLGDLNGDFLVDLTDYELFANCMGGPGQAPPPQCSTPVLMRADIQCDGDVDVQDAALLQRHFGSR